MRHLFGLLVLLGCLASSQPVMAMDAQQVPEQLRPWIPWVSAEQPESLCPFFFRDAKQKRCSWPGALQLDLNAKAGRFSAEWTLYQPDWAILPGDSRFWPQNVLVEQRPAIVVEHQGKPAIWLDAGHYRISGAFFWDRLPESLPIADDTGLIRLSVDGKSVAYPRIDRGGLWLASRQDLKPVLENRMDLQVFRQVIDDNPLQVLTRLELNVSGTAREISLAHALLPNFIPVRLDSVLPARIEADGRLRIQVRPGRWQIELHSRHPLPLTDLKLAIADPAWPAFELWAFRAVPEIRLAEIEGLVSVDASQTNMPPEWRHLPAYQVEQGRIMHFKVIRRGDPEPEPNQLNLQRRFWLDFDGEGYSVSDRINGRMTRDWRLNALPETQLGQVLLNGQNQLITLSDVGAGIEIRRGELDLRADSRLLSDVSRLSAVGWQQSFRKVDAEINMPPGWRLLAVSGVDNDPDSWLAHWTLLDLFLVLIIALAIGRLWSWPWAGVALLGLVLFWHEADAPRWIWLNTLAALALLRVLPAGRFAGLVRGYRNLCWLGLLVIGLPFMVAQLRIGLYPQLERPQQAAMPLGRVASMAPQILDDMAEPMMMAEEVATAPAMLKSLPRAVKPAEPKAAVNFQRVDPEANIQTGPGLPKWQWRRVRLVWNGAVDSQQQIRLWYLSPGWFLLLHIAQVLFVGLLACKMFGIEPRHWRMSFSTASAVLLIPLLLAASPDDARADFPDQTMLEQLKARLLEPPPCLPSCAQIPSMQVSIKPDELQMALQVHVQQALALPLPARLNQWFPQQIKVDGHDAGELIRQADGSLWLGLAAGVHNVVLQGRHEGRDKFSVPLPLPPQYVRVIGDGWQVAGLYENGKVGPQLEFNRLTAKPDREGDKLGSSQLPPFVRVERTLQLGLDWRVTTRVLRLAGSDAPVVLALPLLPGESVTSPDVRVKDGKVLLNMASGQQRLQWQSMLQQTERLTLNAGEAGLWTELWRADVSPIWHLQISGIAVVHHQGPQGVWLPEWRPWPNESVELAISRPQAQVGQTLTIDKSQLELQPGKRGLSADLALDLRSSKGGQHMLRLPPGAELQNVTIDGMRQVIRQQDGSVTLPIRPGTQHVALAWQTVGEQAVLLNSPSVNLGIASVNSHIRVLLGEDRWVLFTSGPSFGPAALIWGMLMVLGLVAFALDKLRMVPLQAWQWFLLLIGLSQLPVEASVVVVAWLFVLGWRGKHYYQDRLRFNLTQTALGLLTVLALGVLMEAIHHGLLGMPDMQIVGNHSTTNDLNWYQDRAVAELPKVLVVSLPMGSYRALMLAWSLWMAISLLDWLRWGWRCFAFDGLWRPKSKPAIS